MYIIAVFFKFFFFTFLQFFVLHFSDNTEVLFIYFKVLLRGTF